MIGFRMILLLLTFVLAVPAGCQTRSFRFTLEMPPANVATVRVAGTRPFVLIKNQGPGSLDVTFDAGIALDREQHTIGVGATAGTTLHGSKVVTVTTGSDDGTVVQIEAHRASNIAIHGPLPK